MSNQVARVDASEEIITALRASHYPGASDQSLAMVLSYCHAAGLDPMQKPVHIVPMWDSASRSMRDVVMPGISLYRIQAERTGLFAGVSKPEWGEMVTEKLGGVEVTYPEWCRVTVYKIVAGNSVAFEAEEYWLENYASKGKDNPAPNAMWAKRPRGQLAKCAEAQALRRAFPSLASVPTAEEMDGKPMQPEEAPTRTEAEVLRPIVEGQTVDAVKAAGRVLWREWPNMKQQIADAVERRVHELQAQEAQTIEGEHSEVSE